MLLAAAVGCVQPSGGVLTPPEQEVVWPREPDTPRLRYLGELKGSQDVGRGKGFGEVWRELLHGPEQPSLMVSPHSVAVHPDGERAAVADPHSGVHIFNLAGRSYRRIEGCGSEVLASPTAVAWAGDHLWVGDSRLNAIAIMNLGNAGQAGDGHPGRRKVGEAVVPPCRLIRHDSIRRPGGLAFNPFNGLCYLSDAGTHSVTAFHPDGTIAFEFGSQGAQAGQFNFPAQIACGPDGTLAVADALNFRIQRFAPDGTPLGEFGQKGDAPGDLALPKGVAIDADGNLWVVDAHFENMQAFTPDGTLLLAVGHEGHGPGEFWLPAGIASDSRGRLWVADGHNGRVQVFEQLP